MYQNTSNNGLSGNSLIALVAAARLSGKLLKPKDFMTKEKRDNKINKKKLMTFKQFSRLS